jgi:hypothetical protein
MICRIWHGWTTPAKAGAYEAVVRGQVIPGIEAMQVPGFRQIDLMRRDVSDEARGDEVEFATIMWFDDLAAIKGFVGEDYTVSHVPAAARAVLKRFDAHAAHYDVVDRRAQPAA